MIVDAAFAAWLRGDSRTAIATTANAAAWGDSAVDRALLSPLALGADAAAEAARQADILRGPLAIDEHDVDGDQVALVGRCVTIVADRLGYAAGRDVIVLGAEVGAGITTLTVLARLG